VACAVERARNRRARTNAKRLMAGGREKKRGATRTPTIYPFESGIAMDARGGNA
jgi:hypothetical protein